MAENVVKIRKFYHRAIIRIVLKGKIFYRYAILESTTSEISFDFEGIKAVLGVRKEADWRETGVDWDTAYKRLEERVHARMLTSLCQGKGFFITVRPLQKEKIMVGSLP